MSRPSRSFTILDTQACAALRRLAFAALSLAAAAPAAWTQEAALLRSEISRQRSALEALPRSPLGDEEIPRLKGLLDEASGLLNSGHTAAALENLASAIPGGGGISRASTGWDDASGGAGKNIDALAREWEEVGLSLKAARGKFPTQAPPGQSAYVRALAEQSMGQIDEQYIVAVDYGRVSGTSSGAYYLGRAEGHLAFGLFLSALKEEAGRRGLDLPPLSPFLARLEDDIVSAYARPGSTQQHTNFIIANASLKLARELDQKGWHLGSLLTLMRSRFALALATMEPRASEGDRELKASLESLTKSMNGASVDQTIGMAWVDKAQLSLAKAETGGEGADRERLRAWAITQDVLPLYFRIVGGPGTEATRK